MELQDKIGREDIINKISYLVDNLRKDEHFCLALDGEWGSGKTFVMGMLEEKFSKHPEYLIVKYDAWKNNFYSEPLIAILSCVIDAMQERLSEINGFQEAMKAAGKDALDSFLKSNKQAGKIASFIKVIARVISRFQKPFQKFTTKESISEFKSYQSLLGDIQECLTKIIEYQGGQNNVNKIIILVDEIDRCLPNEQLTVLERMHHLFEVKNCAVIVAVNKTNIELVFERSYGGQSKTYFRKFFDYNFKLSMQYRTFMKNLVRDYLDELNEKLSPENLFVKQDADYLGDSLGKWCAENGEFDNRECERLIKVAKEICKHVPHRAMNYGYLWFIFKMTFEKLYGNYFNVFKNGTASNLYFAEDLDYMMKPLNITSTFPFGPVSIPIYNDMKINNLNYMLNQFAQRNNANLFSSRSSLWRFQHGVKAICNMPHLEEIMDWIDNYKE